MGKSFDESSHTKVVHVRRLTVANEMLSLLGSLQPDPFSPRHVVQHNTEGRKEEAEEDGSIEEGGSESDSETSSDSDREEVDTMLGKRKELEDEEPVVEKKRKR